MHNTRPESHLHQVILITTVATTVYLHRHLLNQRRVTRCNPATSNLGDSVVWHRVVRQLSGLLAIPDRPHARRALRFLGILIFHLDVDISTALVLLR